VGETDQEKYGRQEGLDDLRYVTEEDRVRRRPQRKPVAQLQTGKKKKANGQGAVPDGFPPAQEICRQCRKGER
jgi:hypothetical protein